MNRILLVPALFIASLPLAGCDSREQRLRSMVGNGTLPLTKVRPEETIGIRVAAPAQNDRQVFTAVLKPDGRLSIERFRALPADLPYTDPKIASEIRKETKLTPALATTIRSKLSVFRPEALSKEGPFIMPQGCGFSFHVRSRAVVGFDDGKGGGGNFILQETCRNRNAESLVNELNEILGMLPEARSVAPPKW